ncbi:MAG: adenylosuccinate synthase [Bacteroidota bacterium]
MKVDVILGLQWGDEGKGKIVDVITPNYDIVARFQGGPNAGHTLKFDNKKFVLHTIPSGIFRANTLNVIGNGVIIDPVIILNKEINPISEYVDVRSKLLFSEKSHLILPSHRLLDFANEKMLGNSKIGSTLKGIGPTYTDKTARNGIRMGDISLSNFKQKYNNLTARHFQLISSMGISINDITIEGYSFEVYEQKWFEAIEVLKQYQLINCEYFINNALKEGKRILAEGAQGSLLDLDYGSYPFVTSSSTIAAGVCSGLGIPPSSVGEVFGIFKAYCTRVGSGPFPTELNNEIGEKLREIGGEFGSTTGRARRCGWLDLPMLKYSCMLNGVTQLIMMKADVLDNFASVDVCTDYIKDGKVNNQIPYAIDESVVLNYTSFEGWEKAKNSETLPSQLQSYVKFIADYVETPITIVSMGPDRTQTIFLNK